MLLNLMNDEEQKQNVFSNSMNNVADKYFSNKESLEKSHLVKT